MNNIIEKKYNFENKNKIKNIKIEIYSIYENNVFFSIYDIDNKIGYIQSFECNCLLNKLLYYEIINESKLWNYNITYDASNIKFFNVIVKINETLINKYLKKSLALNMWFQKYYENLPNFYKFKNETSFLPNVKPINNISNFKIDLYNYQKKSLQKMLDIENNKYDNKIQYTTTINNIIYEPIKNKSVNKHQYINIKSSGGILADEMGLGKTITTIGLITLNPSNEINNMIYSKKSNSWKINSKATVIICPSHLVKQWEVEILRVNPELKITFLLTKKDHEKLLFKDFIDVDIIITSNQFIMNIKHYLSINYTINRLTSYTFNTRYEHRKSVLKDYFIKNIFNEEVLDSESLNILKHNSMPLFEYFHFHRIIIDEAHEIFANVSGNNLINFMTTWIKDLDSKYNWYVSGSPLIKISDAINCLDFINIKLEDNKSNILTSQNLKDKNDKKNVNINFLNKEYIWNNILEKLCIRHRKIDICNEISLLNCNEMTYWLNFTQMETNLYETKKNTSSNIALQQLCCHPLLIAHDIFGNRDLSLDEMQEKLINHHQDVLKIYTHKLEKLENNNPAYYMTKKTYENKISESKYILLTLEKLENKTETDDNCLICMEELNYSNDLSMTNCGHIFCTPCIITSLEYKSLCPLCKKPTKKKDIYSVNKKENKSLIEPVIEKYGSKLGNIIILIKKIISSNKNSKIIIFSQWDYMLLLIGKTLTDNEIDNCFVKGNVYSRNNAISKFKTKNINQVIILSLNNSASGTNLTEASDIIFVEPIDNTIEHVKAIEGQAIARAHRIGQKNIINIHRFLIKNTIEEEIYNRFHNIN